MSMSGSELIEAAKREVSGMTINEVKDKLNSGEELVVLDIREPDEWEEGHVPEATFLARGRIEGNAEKLFPEKDTLIVCY